MLPIQMVETERDDFDGTIVELWRGDDFIGMVFWDGDAPIVQIYADGDGDVQDLDVREIQQLLDTALQIVDPTAFDDDFASLREAVAEEADDESDVHPATSALLAEFDEWVTEGALAGSGSGNSADGRLGALRNMIVVAGDYLDQGEVTLAVAQLEAVLERCDGDSPPPTSSRVTQPQSSTTWSRR